MSGSHYLILGYVIGLTLLWGYAGSLLIESMRRTGKKTEGEES